MELTAYSKNFVSKMRTLAQSYLQVSEPLSTTERCCVSIKKNEFSITYINRVSNVNEIVLLQKLHFDTLNDLSLVLQGMTETTDLAHTPIYWMLSPDDYQLNLLESMPVPASEMLTALSWRIRSLINYPIEEAVLEYFELPAKKGAQSTPLIAAITAQKSLLQPVVSMFRNCNLNLVTIDIPELALLNLVAVYEDDEKCSAFLYLYEKTLILNISSQKVLYFTRRINIAYTPEAIIDYEKLSLEILRYFDFFRSQWRLPSPTRIFAAAEANDIALISTALTERLLNTVVPYTLNNAIPNDAQRKEVATKYLLDYGCLLRKESSHAPSGN